MVITPDIEFLSIEKAAIAILDESYEPYFSKLEIREIAAFVNEEVPTTDLAEARQFARQKFASAVTDFSEKEKECISFVVNKTVALLQKNHAALMATHPWKFIKIQDWLCGGFAHTRGTYIILSQKHIDHLSKAWSDKMSAQDEKELLKQLGGLLVHEQMHSLQRVYKSKFDTLYTRYWKFVQAKVEEERAIQVDQVSNPDAPVAEWLIQKDSNYYWLRTLLKGDSSIPTMGKDFVDKVFVVEKTGSLFRVKRNEHAELIYKTLDDIPFYKNAFPTTRGLDHPNEISAYMFSDYFKDLVAGKKPMDQVPKEARAHTELFLEWLGHELAGSK